ncbi:MAG: hypothetical protein EPN40_10715 [Rhodanobacteraceae bacterium]|nr:MAG: hypothetical protein EPN40_10715 [Rhodanobacteraceae bacterium]
MNDHALRMLRDAEDRLSDASILVASLDTRSDAASLLRILALEVLLKCAVITNGGTPQKSHNYLALWQSLPKSAQDAILTVAADRMPGHADLSNLEWLLPNYRFVFERARYFYEFYEGYTLQEQSELGKFWVDLGSPEHEADVQYKPNELTCLIDGLLAYVKRELGVDQGAR